jgi:hypothetical protein
MPQCGIRRRFGGRGSGGPFHNYALAQHGGHYQHRIDAKHRAEFRGWVHGRAVWGDVMNLLTLVAIVAVIIVGPIDGDTGSHTLNEIANAERTAAILQANGATVHRFYTPDNDWEEIKAAAQGAHFFLYRGHGHYLFPLSLKDSDIPAFRISELQLWPGAVTMFYSCYSAGSSKDDTEQISSEEALRRVVAYSQPFMDIGVAMYYASWYYNAWDWHVTLLLDGQVAGKAYQNDPYYNMATLETYEHPTIDEYVVWLGKQYTGDMWRYNHAFLGNPDGLAQWEMYRSLLPIITKEWYNIE